MDERSAGAGEPPAGHYSWPADLFAECERLTQQAAEATTNETSLRQVAGDVGRVLLRMADDPGLLHLLAPAEAATPSAQLTRRDLLRIPWEDHLSRCGYEGPPPARALAEQLIHAITGEPPGLPPTNVKDLQNLLSRLGTKLTLDADDDSPGSHQAILYRIGVALWTIARVAFAAAFAAIVSGLRPGLAPAAPLIAVVVHQIAPEVAKAAVEQAMPDLRRRPGRTAGSADPDSVGILLTAPGAAEALLARWRDVDAPVDPDLVTMTRRWCDGVQSALFVQRYHERVRGGDFVRPAADATWRLRQRLEAPIAPTAVADALSQARHILEGHPDSRPAPSPDVETAPPQPPSPPTPQATGTPSVEEVRTSPSGPVTELETVMGLLTHAARDLAAIRDQVRAAMEGSGNQQATATVNDMTSMADALHTMTTGIRDVVDKLGAYGLEIGAGTQESQPVSAADTQDQGRPRLRSLHPVMGKPPKSNLPESSEISLLGERVTRQIVPGEEKIGEVRSNTPQASVEGAPDNPVPRDSDQQRPDPGQQDPPGPSITSP